MLELRRAFPHTHTHARRERLKSAPAPRAESEHGPISAQGAHRLVCQSCGARRARARKGPDSGPTAGGGSLERTGVRARGGVARANSGLERRFSRRSPRARGEGPLTTGFWIADLRPHIAPADLCLQGAAGSARAREGGRETWQGSSGCKFPTRGHGGAGIRFVSGCALASARSRERSLTGRFFRPGLA